ncbi:NADPH-dependent FMN reductase [Streptomyces sp. NPDC059639]|uniref:NADPH-dependent FMN reductase n=1 Tax=Streptomyces sp. NPDC059639 TaxID=3346891 RepID=UPI0036B44698
MAEPQDDPRLNVAVIVGSTREGRFGPAVGDWLLERMAQREDMTVDLVDLVRTPVPAVLPDITRPPRPEDAELLERVSPRLEAADAFVVITPEYNHSYPGGLKTAIDWHNLQWHGKPVAFVSYGGIAGGLRAVEALRVVFGELNVVTIRNTVSFHDYPQNLDADGRPTDPACDVAAKSMLDQLAWWGLALREARTARPFSA